MRIRLSFIYLFKATSCTYSKLQGTNRGNTEVEIKHDFLLDIRKAIFNLNISKFGLVGDEEIYGAAGILCAVRLTTSWPTLMHLGKHENCPEDNFPRDRSAMARINFFQRAWHTFFPFSPVLKIDYSHRKRSVSGSHILQHKSWEYLLC